MSYYPEFAQLLDTHIANADLSSARVARRIGVNPSTVTRWRNGHSRPRTPELVVQVADVLGIHGTERDALLRAASYAPAEVETTHQTETSLAPPNPINLSILPNPTYRNLIDRKAELALALDALQDTNGRWIIGIDGIGGIGKTALAHGIIQACQKQRLFDVYLWVSATNGTVMPHAKDTEQTVATGGLTYEGMLNTILQQMSLPELVVFNEVEKEPRVLALLRQQKVLIILDNLETAAEAQDRLLARLFLLLNPSKAVCTSRLRFQSDVFPLHLEGLDTDATAQLMQQEAQERLLPQLKQLPAARVAEFAEVSGGAPLMIKLAMGQASYLPFQTIIDQIRTARSGTDKRNQNETLHRQICQPSWYLLSSEAQKLLVALALFIPGEGGVLAAAIAISGLTADEAVSAIEELWQLSLIEVTTQSVTDIGAAETGGLCYYLHPLTTTFVIQDICGWQRDRISALAHVDAVAHDAIVDYGLFWQACVERGMAYIEEQIAFHGDRPPPESIRRLAMRMLDFGLEIAEIWPVTGHLLVGLAEPMEQTGHRNDWIFYLQQGIERSRSSQDVKVEAELNLQLGIMYRLLSRYAEADAYYARGISRFKAVRDIRGQAKIMIRQAQMRRQQRKYAEASQLIEAAFEFLIEDDVERARGYTVKGEIANDDDRWEEAVHHFEQALELWTRANNQRMRAWNLTNLGAALRSLEKYQEAIEYYKEAIDVLGDTNEPVHWAGTHVNLGNVYLALQEPQEALRQYALAEPVFQKTHDQLRLAVIDSNRGIAYRELKLWKQSRDAYRSSIKRYQQLGNIEMEANALDGLGLVYMQQGEHKEAKTIFMNTLSLLAQFEGEPGWAYLHKMVQQHLRESLRF